ncbi:probable inactive receptor kinase At5g67200 [Morus notabilis]|uniref:probable inactive receptor kinase At5g67200 n=1 Tax=Morus notabilis TaxID=981085 RepID=UPI000CED0C20|nr:probable inactive receptor kinase At5g67200 [Morus notabilis]
MPLTHALLFLTLTLTLPTLLAAAAAGFLTPPLESLLRPSDAVSLITFKSKADLDNKLLYVLNERFDYCQWRGVKCAQGRVVRLVLQGYGLRGVFPPDSLTRLDQLRVLSLNNNSLSGPIPDLSPLVNLKSLFLDRNSFSGAFPPSILTLHRLLTLDLSFNNFSGPIPAGITALDRLNSLRLQWNRFNGTLPPLNQSLLFVFNVSRNNLTGAVPVTPSLSRFGASSFLWNPGLCGEVLNKACSSPAPFFDSPNVTGPPSSQPLVQSAESQSVVLSPPSPKNHKKTGLILGISIAVAILITAFLCMFTVIRTLTSQNRAPKPAMEFTETAESNSVNNNNNYTASETRIGEINESDTKAIEESRRVHQSGDLVFCAGESQLYGLEQLMRASAELLGRGTIGTTYKAVLDNQLIVTVKRLDAGKTAVTGGDGFERHMEAVGRLRHPNLVLIRAYFQAKGERLVIYDYQPNGSLFNLIHGSRSTRAKPLHWTSCLKIAEDVAQGLAYIHQVSRLIHGNLKSSNVLLGSDFEACLTDYSLAILADTSANDDPDSAGYKAPETRKSNRRATAKSDVYAFGILLLELLTSKHPSQHPFLLPTDVPDWVRATREDDVGEDGQLRMLTEVACICSLTSPEQRPAMWQVLKMIQEIKESVMTDHNSYAGYS